MRPGLVVAVLSFVEDHNSIDDVLVDGDVLGVLEDEQESSIRSTQFSVRGTENLGGSHFLAFFSFFQYFVIF